MTTISPKELLGQLREMIRLIAAPAGEQLEFLTEGVPAPPDELFLQFDMAVPHWFERLKQNNLLADRTEQEIVDLHRYLSQKKDSLFWQDDALISSREWDEARERAGRVLALIPPEIHDIDSLRGRLNEFLEVVAVLAAPAGEQIEHCGEGSGAPGSMILQFRDSCPSWSDLRGLRRAGLISADTDKAIRRLYDSFMPIRSAAISRWRGSGDRSLLDNDDVLRASPDWEELRVQARGVLRGMQVEDEGPRGTDI
jgi:hypothetical protein